MNFMLDANSKNEYENIKKNLRKSYFCFIERLSEEKFYKKGTQQKIDLIRQLNPSIKLCKIPDKVLEKLYSQIVNKYRSEVLKKHISSGFEFTCYERMCLKNIEDIIEESKRKYSKVVLYPTVSKLKSKQKLVIGPHIPDIVLSGLSDVGYAMTIIEVDGFSHENKTKKDAHYYRTMKDLGIHVYQIYNDKANDYAYIGKVIGALRTHKKKSWILKEQRCWRRIWLYTISYHLPVEELEKFLNREGVEIDLKQCFIEMSRLENCPRKIKKEARANMLC